MGQTVQLYYLLFLFSPSEIKSHHYLRRLEKGLYNHFSVGHMTEIKASRHSFSKSASEDKVSSFQYTEKEAQVMVLFLCTEIIKWRIKSSISHAANCKMAVFPRNAKEFAFGVKHVSLKYKFCNVQHLLVLFTQNQLFYRTYSHWGWSM